MKRVAMGRRQSAAVCMAVGAMGLMGGEMASGATWIGPAGGTYSWFEPLWTPNSPSTSETVYIGNGGAPIVNSGAAVAGTIYLGLGYSLSQSGGLVVGGTGQVSTSNTLSVGYGGYGWVQQSGGAVVTNGLQFGGNTRASGSYTLSDGMLEVGGTEYLGYAPSTTAQFNQSGGIHSTTYSGSTLVIAYGSGSAANYSLSGGQLSSYSLTIGAGTTSSGSMTQTGGQNTTGTLSVGSTFNSVGSYALGGTGQLTSTAEYVGYGSTGVFNQTGGINRAGSTLGGSSSFFVGYLSGSQGTYNLSGNGQLLAAGAEHIGYGTGATGIMTQTGGVNSLGNAVLYVGAYQPTSTGIYQLGGTGTLTAGAEFIGYTGSGTFTGMGAFQQSGGTNLADTISVGTNGRYDMTGGTAQVRSTFGMTGKVTIGDPANPSAAPSLSTSILNVGVATYGTGAGSLTLTSSAGVDVSTSLHVYPAGTLAIKSGTLTAPSLINDGIVTLTGGTLTLTGGSQVGAPASITGLITGSGAISIGPGVTLKAGYIRQGSVSVAGSLQLKHIGNGSAFNDLSIAPGGSVVLADDMAAWNYTGASPAGVLRQYLKSGQNGGDWAGPGLSSSAAAGDVVRVLGIGYIEATDMGVTTWGGVTVDSTSLLLKVVPYGDANLDGTITTDDYTLLDRGLALGYSGWSNGDFNYDGAVDSADVLIIDRSLAIQNGTLPSPSFLAEREAMYGESYVAELIASVPEPGTVGMAVGGAMCLLSRRRGRRS